MTKIICALAMLITVNIQACWIGIYYPAHTELRPTTTITVNGTAAVDGAYYVTIPATIEVTTAAIKGQPPDMVELYVTTSTDTTGGRLLVRYRNPPVGVTAPLFGRGIVNATHGSGTRSWSYRIREWQGSNYRDTVILILDRTKVWIGGTP